MSSPTLSSKEQNRDWLDLPSDITTNILKRIGVVDILENVQKVCTAWHKICKDPSMWRVIKIDDLTFQDPRKYRQAVDRSQGQLVDITIEDYRQTELLSYVANRSKELKRLEIIIPYGEIYTRIREDLMKFPVLEELNIYFDVRIPMKKEFVETVGRYCPMLKVFKLNQTTYEYGWFANNEIAVAIGENLHELTHLELIGNNMSNVGLEVILDGCLYLETLDLRNCLSIDLKGDMGKRCSKQIKNLIMPVDYLKGSPYSYIYDDNFDSDDDYY